MAFYFKVIGGIVRTERGKNRIVYDHPVVKWIDLTKSILFQCNSKNFDPCIELSRPIDQIESVMAGYALNTHNTVLTNTSGL